MTAMVDIRSVHKSFGSLEVLRGIDLEVRSGEVAVVLGPSGSGKSTLLRAINHLEKVDSGWISVGGSLSATAARATASTSCANARSSNSAPGSASSSRTSISSRI